MRGQLLLGCGGPSATLPLASFPVSRQGRASGCQTQRAHPWKAEPAPCSHRTHLAAGIPGPCLLDKETGPETGSPKPEVPLLCSETCAICISNSSSRASQTLDIRPPQLNTSGYSASSEGGHDHELPSRAQCRSARPCAILGCVFKDLNCSGLLRNLEETLGPSTPRAALPGSAAWGCGRRAHRGSVLAPEQQRGDRRGADARSTSFRPITCQRAESEAGRATLRAL